MPFGLQQYLLMETLTLCWIFDKRWLFGLPNPFMEFLLVLPIGFNIGTIAAIVLQRNSYRLDVGEYFITLVALYALQSLVCLYILLRSYFLAEQQLEEVTDNYEAIREFTHHFESKKSIWGLAGLLATGLVVAQIIINHLYISNQVSLYPCRYSQIRFWIDILCWSYIGLIVLIFLICKLVFLFISWKHPQFYLQYKDVV